MENKKKSTKKKNTNTKKTNSRKKSTIKKTSTKKTSVKKTINKQVIKEDNKKNNIKFIKSFLITLLILVLIYGISLLLSLFVIPTVRIYDNSMLPGLNDENIIMLYKTNKVKKGDVVAVYVEDKMLIKRCVATSNDVVNIDTDGNLYVNDKLVKENYLKNKSIGKFSIDLPSHCPVNPPWVRVGSQLVNVDGIIFCHIFIIDIAVLSLIDFFREQADLSGAVDFGPSFAHLKFCLVIHRIIIGDSSPFSSVVEVLRE